MIDYNLVINKKTRDICLDAKYRWIWKKCKTL